MDEYTVVGDVEAEVLVGELIYDLIVGFELFDTGGGVLKVVVGWWGESGDDEYSSQEFNKSHVDLK